MIPKAFRNGAVMLILLMGSVVLLGSVLLSPTPTPSRDYSAFLADVKSGSVSKVVQQEQTLTVTNTKTPPETYQVEVPTQLTDVYGDLVAAATAGGIDPAGIAFGAKQPDGSGQLISLLLSAFLPVLLIGGLFIFMMRSAQGQNNQAMSFGKSKARMFIANKTPVTFADVAGVDEAKVELAEVVEFLKFPERFESLGAKIPKGVLLYGPPGCGKTLIAKAVARSLADKVRERTGREDAHSYFLNVKGPELLNKYVGETERQIRLVFQRAREKAEEGVPVIVFFDEMDSLFRTRGTGISSDMESTVVPQLLAEIDGVEALRDVIVIGASNREDLIDPAILRPGRLDVKIKIERPDEHSARQIFSRYLTSEIPLQEGADLQEMIALTVDEMYRTDDHNQFLEVTYQNSDKEVLYFKDFASGAMIENIVRRAKKRAIKRVIAGGSRGVALDDLLASIRQEFKEHEDLPNTTNPDDWARISGRKGERIVFIRTLVKGDDTADREGGRAIERVATGQYL